MAKDAIACAPKIKKDKTATNVVTVVFILRVKDCKTLRFTIFANFLYDLTWPSNRMFSLIRSNITIVLLIEYPTIVKIAATIVDRKSTRLNSSHVAISYAVFCLKKK